MRKLVAVLGLLFAALLFGQSLHAQTTYTLNRPFTCDAVGYYPVTSWSEFTCRGVFYYDAHGDSAELYLWAALPRLYVIAANFTMYNGTFQLTSFTQPSGCSEPNGPLSYTCSQPGTFAFNWSGTDTNNNPHSGTVSATWISKDICGGERCWFHPILESGSALTVNQ